MDDDVYRLIDFRFLCPKYDDDGDGIANYYDPFPDNANMDSWFDLFVRIIFFLVVTPIGLFMRLLGKDLINLKKHSLKSYWIEKKYYKSTMKDQF